MSVSSPSELDPRRRLGRRQRKAEAYLGFPESAFVRLNALLPGVVDRALFANDRKAASLFAT